MGLTFMLALSLDPSIMYSTHTQGQCKSLIASQPHENDLRKQECDALRDKLSYCCRHLMVVSIMVFHALEIKCIDRAAFGATAVFLLRNIKPVQLMALSWRASAPDNARRVQ